MYCGKCGKLNQDDARFCDKCGAPIKQERAENAQAIPAMKPHSESAAMPATNLTAAEGQSAIEITANAPQTPLSESPKASSPNTKIIIGAIAVVTVAIIAVIFIFNSPGCSSSEQAPAVSGQAPESEQATPSILGQTTDTFKEAFEREDIARKGVVNSRYVNDSAYSVTSFSCDDMRKADDDTIEADIKATVENDSFKTDLVITGTYYEEAGSSNSGRPGQHAAHSYKFEVLSSTTTPKKGIDFDNVNNLTNCESVLSEDGMSCTVTDSSTYDFWFATATHDLVYSYKFDGTTWAYEDRQEKDKYEYKDAIEGEYKAKTGRATKFESFTVSNVDVEKGTFTIDYTVNDTDHNGAGLVSGTVEATIDPKTYVAFATESEDHYYYYFEAVGTSDKGDGQAKIIGCLSTSTNGEATISITSTAIDYILTSFGTDYSAQASFVGTLFKQ